MNPGLSIHNDLFSMLWAEPLPDVVQKPPEIEATQLPPFIRPLPGHLDALDIKHMERKGAFEMRSPWEQEALVRTYVDFIHPRFPLLNLSDLLCLVCPPTVQPSPWTH